MGRLVIDISELADWEGKLTGVPRVMNELSLRFAMQQQCDFVKWNDQLKQYDNVDYHSLGANPSVAKPTVSSQAGIRTKLRDLKNHSSWLRKGYETAVHIKGKAQKPAATPITVQAASIEPGDTLFIMADWHGNQPEFVPHLLSLQSSGIKLVQISYDMLPIITPQYSGHATQTFTNYVTKVYPLCDLIFSISRNTRDDIANWLKAHNLNVPPIATIRLGDDFKKSELKRPNIEKLDQERFILCVGTVEARKNHTLLYYVYKLATQRSMDLPPLVVVGRRGWLSDDIYEMMTVDPEVKDKLIFMHHTSDEELAWLYSNCLFSIYPSFYEGWGLPIAESIAHGVPCLASNTSSMPEVAGNLIDYFSPTSSDECLAAVVNLLNPAVLQEARERIEAYRPTSWDETFKQVSEAVGKIHG